MHALDLLLGKLELRPSQERAKAIGVLSSHQGAVA